MSRNMYRKRQKPVRSQRRAFLASGCEMCGRPTGRRGRINADYSNVCHSCYRRFPLSLVQ